MSFLSKLRELTTPLPRPPATILAVYKCRLCNDKFEVDPRDQSIAACDRYHTVADTHAWTRIQHTCNERCTGLADFCGMRKVIV